MWVNIPPEVLRDAGHAVTRASFRAAWSYRLELPRGVRERALDYTAKFREAVPEARWPRALRHVPAYLQNSQGTTSTPVALVSLARKALFPPPV